MRIILKSKRREAQNVGRRSIIGGLLPLVLGPFGIFLSPLTAGIAAATAKCEDVYHIDYIDFDSLDNQIRDLILESPNGGSINLTSVYPETAYLIVGEAGIRAKDEGKDLLILEWD